MTDPARIQRFTKDAALVILTALAAAGATANSAAINLGAVEPGQLVNEFDVLIEVPATPSLVDAKTVIFTLQDSADGTTFAAIPELATLTILGAGGVGAAAAERRVKLPTSVRQYLRLSQVTLAAGGDNTAISSTLSLVF